MLQKLCKRTFLVKVYAKQLTTVATTSVSSNGTSPSKATDEKHQKFDPDTNDYAQQHWDEFTKEFMQNRIEMSPFQKVFLAVGSSIASIVDPRRYPIPIFYLIITMIFKSLLPNRHDMIAALGETTGERTLQNILLTMKSSEEGQRILLQKPRINTRTVNIERLRQLPENTFGRAYVKFLDDNVRT